MWNRVRNSGYQGFVLTCDTQLFGKRPRDVHNKFMLPYHLSISNYDKYKGTGAEDIRAYNKTNQSNASALADFMDLHKDNKFSWEIISFIKKKTGNMPIIAKGIMLSLIHI